LSLLACSAKQRRIVYGANLPMLIKLVKSRNLDLPEAVTLALDAARKYINAINVSESIG
jgi:mannose PTS system EIIA component